MLARAGYFLRKSIIIIALSFSLISVSSSANAADRKAKGNGAKNIIPQVKSGISYVNAETKIREELDECLNINKKLCKLLVENILEIKQQ